jgi:hypothetical protein
MYTNSDIEKLNSRPDLDLELEGHFIQTEGKFKCNFCNRAYTTPGWVKNHLKTKHSVDIALVSPQTNEKASNYDGKYNYASSFMKKAMLFRDTRDCFKMGDGNILFRNLKFLLLHFDVGKHTKYRLWSYRLLAYDLGLLSVSEQFIYRNNISVNMIGGTRNCIANT